MKERLVDARLQTTAGIALLNSSLLVAWQEDRCRFSAPASGQFEDAWRSRHQHPFGRLICWMQLAAGSEFLLKGVCLANNVEIRMTKQVPAYPQAIDSDWPSRFLADWKSGGIQEVTNFGTLGDLTKQTKKGSCIAKLSTKVNATDAEFKRVAASYEFLQRTIRNRDAHAYVPNVRESHHEIARTLLCDSFNLLVQWMPEGPEQVNEWLSEASDFINHL